MSKRRYIPLIVSVALTLACGAMPAAAIVANTGTPTATAEPTLESPATISSIFTITGNVYIRDLDGIVTGVATTGETFGGWCGVDWCYPNDHAKIWRGCTDHADGRGCK